MLSLEQVLQEFEEVFTPAAAPVETYDAELKAKLPDGPWQAEPDRIEWRSQGFPCLITRNDMGNLCGYVAVPPGHPWHGRHEDLSAEVHGGLTYGAPCAGNVCHKAKPGEADDVFWLGFDCAHAGDFVPTLAAFAVSRGLQFPGIYRDVDYVRAEVERLVCQAKEAASATR